MDNARSLLSNLTTRGKIMLGVSIVGVLIVAVLLMRLATSPSYETLHTGLDPAETGKLTAALDEKGVRYKLENNGTALAVEKAKTAQARIALAEQGLPKGGDPGFELFDKQKLGQSDFQQKVNYQRALEGEIARTIEQVDGVSGASVDLVLPDEQLFAEEESPAKAAVLINNDASALEPGAVRGMAQLVASGVKGLKLDQVSITDSTGNLLWPNGEAGASGGTGATGKQAAERRYSAGMEAKLNGLLVQTVGAGKGQVQVSADLNVDEATKDELVYSEGGVPLKTKKETEELEGSGGGAAGGAGTGSNIPSYAGGAGGGGESNYQRESEETDMGVGKTVTRTKVAPGKVEKLNVAVALDKSVPPADAQELETILTTAAGIQPERGDAIVMSQVTFAKQEAEKPSATAGMIGYAKYVALGIATLLFLFFISRHLKKREGEALPADPTWLREIEAPVPLAQLEAAQAPLVADNLPAKAEMEHIAAQNPEMVAQQIRGWMNQE